MRSPCPHHPPTRHLHQILEFPARITQSLPAHISTRSAGGGGARRHGARRGDRRRAAVTRLPVLARAPQQNAGSSGTSPLFVVQPSPAISHSRYSHVYRECKCWVCA
eukprot:gene23234-biopygen10323